MTLGGEPLQPGRPVPLLGWLRGSMRHPDGGGFPAWLRVALSIVVTVGLGAWGFSRLPLQPKFDLLESLYRAVKLYTIDLGPVALSAGTPRGNWQLWVGLLLAALLVVRAVLSLARARLRQAATRHLLRGHVIVCGGGVHGAALVAALSGGPGEDLPGAEAHDVVLLDLDTFAPGMQASFGRHEWRLLGDCVREQTLLSAGAARAHSIVAVTGNDFVNSQVVSAIRALAKKRKVRDRVHVLVQIEDPSLARFLEEETQLSSGESGLPAPVVSPFSANAIAAETLIRDSYVKLPSGELESFLRMRDGKAPNLLLAGDHPLIDAIVLGVLRHWRVRRLRDSEDGSERRRPPVHVSVFGPGATARAERFRRLWRPEANVMALEARDAERADEPGATAAWPPKTYEWLRMPGRADHAIVACVEELDGVRLTLDVNRALGERVLMTRVTTELGSALDEHISDRLAATEVKSLAKLACKPDKMRRLAAQQRLTDAIASPPDRPELGVARSDAAALSATLFARPGLELHSDSEWRVLPCEQPLLEALLDPVRLSAVLWAGLRINLGSRENLLRAARTLAGSGRSGDALSAWCEYARQVDGDTRAELLAELGALDPAALAAKILRLRAFTLGCDRELSAPVHEHILGDARRVAIFAGGAGSMPLLTTQALAPLLERALIGYDGFVLCGGTAVGLPGVVGQVTRKLGVRTVGYVPAGRGDRSLYPRLRETSGDLEFSVREPLAMWEDILGSGIPVENVRVTVFPGGSITILELQLARALGARVAWLDPAGEVPLALEDMLPLGVGPVIEPPVDPLTLRAFLKWSRLPNQLREPVARHIHSAYRQKHRKRKTAGDPALAPWDDLVPQLQQSNLAQADDIPNKLALVGKRLVKDGDRLDLDDRQIELLAESEHGRYNMERLSAGWQLGERAVTRSISPYLKPWDELDEETKDYDRETILNIDAALRGAGWGVVDGER